MDECTRAELKGILADPGFTVAQKIQTFVRFFNGETGLGPLSWQVSKEAWQRYEFLGDRILNLAAAELLFSGFPASDEGEMTRKMGVVANESLAAIAEHKGVDVALLVPAAIGQQRAYGDAIRGGAIEACYLPKKKRFVFRFDILPSSYLREEQRSEERRVGKECRSRWSPYH